jgi:hypothetical protein
VIHRVGRERIKTREELVSRERARFAERSECEYPIGLIADAHRGEREATSIACRWLMYDTLEDAAQLGALRKLHASEYILHFEIGATIRRRFIMFEDGLQETVGVVRMTPRQLIRNML